MGCKVVYHREVTMCSSCPVPRFSAQWSLSMRSSSLLCDGPPTVDMPFHLRSRKWTSMKYISPTAKLHSQQQQRGLLSCWSPHLAIQSSQPTWRHLKTETTHFTMHWREETPCPTITTIVTPYQTRQGVFQPDSTSCLPKILMLDSHTDYTTDLWLPYRQSHKGRLQQTPEAPAGDEMEHAACIPAGSVISASKGPY